MGWVDLKGLPKEHPLRNNPLISVKAEYRNQSSKIWCEIRAPYNISKKTFNQLSVVWTNWDDWRVPDDL
jgi:hypothetical protein